MYKRQRQGRDGHLVARELFEDVGLHEGGKRRVLHLHVALRDLLGVVALCLAVVGGMLLSRTITRPVNTLVQAARRIRDGHYHQLVQVEGKGEVAELASALNAMQRSIADREEHITRYARVDALTNLPTRLAALDEIEAAILHVGQTGQRVTVMLVDLNNFSDIGSSLG